MDALYFDVNTKTDDDSCNTSIYSAITLFVYKYCQVDQHLTLHFVTVCCQRSIETYKIITGKYQGCVAPGRIKEEIYVTRGNDLRLQKLRVGYDLRKFGFSNRVVNKWNSLPNWVVSAVAVVDFFFPYNKSWTALTSIVS